MQKISITHINNSHSDWLRALDFYKTEIGILQGRLGEVASKYNEGEVLKELEHHQNQLKVQSDRIQQMAHDIHKNISKISQEAQEHHAGYIDGELLVKHNELELAFDDEERIMKNYRKEINRFFVQYM